MINKNGSQTFFLTLALISEGYVQKKAKTRRTGLAELLEDASIRCEEVPLLRQNVLKKFYMSLFSAFVFGHTRTWMTENLQTVMLVFGR